MLTYRQFLSEMTLAFQTYTSPEDAFNFAQKFGYRDANAEEVVMTDPAWALKYAMEIIRGPWPEAEEAIKANPDVWQQYREFVDSLNENSKADGTYFSSPEDAFLYCKKMKRRIPEAEEIIKTSANYAERYAYEVIHGRWPEAEDTIKKSPYEAVIYAESTIRDRWPEAEPWVVHPGMTSCTRYMEFLSRLPFSKKKAWFEKEGVTEHLFWLFRVAESTSPSLQEYIIRQRPDLINKIENLDPRLKRKYQHEEEFSHADL